jgi:hypothetical protein
LKQTIATYPSASAREPIGVVAGEPPGEVTSANLTRDPGPDNRRLITRR